MTPDSFINADAQTASLADAREGARSLLLHTAEVGREVRLLLVNETGGFVEPEVADLIAEEACMLGAEVAVEWAPEANVPEDVSPALMEKSAASDVTIFNHRMATMLRFAPLGGRARRINNFATTRASLAATARLNPASFWQKRIAAVNRRLATARTWRVTCADGTDISGDLAPPAAGSADGLGSPMPTFPAGVHKPLSSLNARGRLTVRWLVSGGMHAFDPSSIVLDSPVTLDIDRGRIAGFSGDARAVERMRTHLDYVGRTVDKDALVINSWHCGVNSQIVPVQDAMRHVEGWFALAHTSCRVAHFHAVGKDVPGEISLPCIDPTVEIDGEVLWRRGDFRMAEESPSSAS